MTAPKRKRLPKIELPDEEPISQSQFTRAAMLRGLIFGTIFGLGLYGYRHGWFSPEAPPTAEEEAQAADQVAQHNVEFGKSLDHTKAATEWRKHLSDLQTTSTRLKENTADLSRILAEIAELETSEEGRKMSGDERCLGQFEVWRAWKPPSEVTMKNWQADLDSYIALCTAAIENEAIIIGPDQQFIEKTQQFYFDVHETCEVVETAASGLKVVKKFSATNEPQEKTIAEVLDERELAQSSAREQEKAFVREEAWEAQLKSELETETAVAAEEQATREVQQRIRIEEAQTARQKEELRLQTLQEQRVAAEAKKQKLARFDKALPEIRSLLAPMISDGTQQIGPAGWNPGEKGPVSLSVLQKCRSLQLDERGMYMLGSIFCDVHDKNDRPQGSFPMEMAAASSKSTIRRAQELLNEYGEILVEKGMLAP